MKVLLDADTGVDDAVGMLRPFAENVLLAAEVGLQAQVGPQFGQGPVKDPVTFRDDLHELDLEAGMSLFQRRSDVFGLPHGERGFAGGDAYPLLGHSCENEGGRLRRQCYWLSKVLTKAIVKPYGRDNNAGRCWRDL